ncbi:MAG: DEAD/DEAH box helicase, partial [Actinomycetota bacterium]|nr:DEAD/DEAH box helicase [Actinomycetota bacterium]
MSALAPLLELLDDEEVAHLLASEAPLTVPEAARPYLLAALIEHLDRPVLALTARIEEADQLARDAQAFLGRGGAEVFPGWEVLPGEPLSPSVDTMGRRIDVLARLARGDKLLVVTTAQGAMQLVAPDHSTDVIEISSGRTLDLDGVSEQLVELGYERNYIVERRGEFAIRGGILDVFPPASERPVRVELWGDEVSSLREFALASQRSLGDIGSVRIAACRELRADATTRERAAVLTERIGDPDLAKLVEGVIEPGVERFLPDLSDGLVPLTKVFPPGSPVVVCEPKRVGDRADEVMEQVREWLESRGDANRYYAELDDVVSGAGPTVLFSSFTPAGGEASIETWTSTAGKPEDLVARVAQLRERDFRAVVAASLPETAERLRTNLAQLGHRFVVSERAPGRDHSMDPVIVVAELSRGFVLPAAKLALVAESDITGRRSGAARRRVAARRRRAEGPLDLVPGDLVVHELHGIGRFTGMVERNLLGVHREYLVIEYAKGDKLYVPNDQVDLVSKYIGGEAPRISRLGSSEWAKAKSRVRRKTREIAKQLVKLYQERARAKGFAFGPDTPWQRELEDSFEFEETPDQLRAIDEVKDDMESTKPMDRLVCGDVGYGKTEIAVRAAFKAVAAGKQVAVLVPTTILASQHLATFKERFHNFPVRVELLSRFLSAAEAKKVMTDLEAGKIDVVVGTHRLLQPSVKFADLGLVIVDEEQRFGVEQKEKLKELRTNVDVLTLTATPIPRTLEMAMSGIRDISIVDTPPENRHPVLTYVGAYEEETVAAAIRRELLRDGQVFYVHHRVDTLDHAANRLQDLVPEARIGVAHGQMEERRLESTMID